MTCRRCGEAFDRGYPDPEGKPYRYDVEALCFPCYERIMDAKTARWTERDLARAFGGGRRRR